MSLSASELERLDEAHRQRQATIQAAAGLAVLRGWRDVEERDILAGGPSVDRWLERSTPLILSAFQRSTATSSAFYASIRAAQVPDAPPFVPEPIALPPIEQIRTSLWVTGVVGARHRIEALPGGEEIPARPAPLEDAGSSVGGLNTFFDRQRETMRAGRQGSVEEALLKSGTAAAGSAMRHVGNGGRSQVKEAQKADVKALGYVRVTRGVGTCYFCAMLASRGKVYKDDSFDLSDPRFEGPGTAKVHDSCRCTLRPIYTRTDEELPEFGRAMYDLWNDPDFWPEESTGSVMNDWRVMYEARFRR